jgi:hypothetical protein
MAKVIIPGFGVNTVQKLATTLCSAQVQVMYLISMLYELGALLWGYHSALLV